jgi:hypothetical protein
MAWRRRWSEILDVRLCLNAQILVAAVVATPASRRGKAASFREISTLRVDATQASLLQEHSATED